MCYLDDMRTWSSVLALILDLWSRDIQVTKAILTFPAIWTEFLIIVYLNLNKFLSRCHYSPQAIRNSNFSLKFQHVFTISDICV
jgi:hypothetical protein